jgi:hypothetical protein
MATGHLLNSPYLHREWRDFVRDLIGQDFPVVLCRTEPIDLARNGRWELSLVLLQQPGSADAFLSLLQGHTGEAFQNTTVDLRDVVEGMTGRYSARSSTDERFLSLRTVDAERFDAVVRLPRAHGYADAAAVDAALAPARSSRPVLHGAAPAPGRRSPAADAPGAERRPTHTPVTGRAPAYRGAPAGAGGGRR